MPEGIFPDYLGTGGLPFLTRGELLRQGGETVAGCESIPISVWPSSPARIERVGGAYDHEAEVPLEFATDFEDANLSLVVEGVTYKVTSAIPQPFLPHVVLNLRKMQPGG